MKSWLKIVNTKVHEELFLGKSIAKQYKCKRHIACLKKLWLYIVNNIVREEPFPWKKVLQTDKKYMRAQSELSSANNTGHKKKALNNQITILTFHARGYE